MTRRPGGPYVHGLDGPVVVVPARVAAWIEAQTGVDLLRIMTRGDDPDIDAVLDALHRVALDHRSRGTQRNHMTCTGSAVAEPGLPGPAERDDLESLLSTSATAMVARVSTRAIRAAIADGRLAGIRRGRRWFVRRDDAERYRDRRLSP